jgi:hypothetical protein
MPYQDFRQFLDVLRQHGELIDVDRPVALSDVGKAMKQSYRRQGPGMMFNNNGTGFPLVAGVYSTRSKALLAFEADEKTILQKVLSGLDHPVAPSLSSAAAPCHEVVQSHKWLLDPGNRDEAITILRKYTKRDAAVTNAVYDLFIGKDKLYTLDAAVDTAGVDTEIATMIEKGVLPPGTTILPRDYMLPRELGGLYR